MKFWDNMSLRKKLFLYFLSASTFFFILLGVSFYSLANQEVRRNAQKSQLVLLENQLQLADNSFVQLNTFLLWLSTNDNLMELLDRPVQESGWFDLVSRNFYSTLDSRLQPIQQHISLLNVRGNNASVCPQGV